jgi:hypothetical protein
MNQIDAKIDMTNPGSGVGTIVNMQIVAPTDVLDPNFIWVQITTQVCTDGSAVQIGCTYDGTNFYPAAGN